VKKIDDKNTNNLFTLLKYIFCINTIAKWEDQIQFSFLERIDKKHWTFF